ncbi:MAG: hypothetical protein JRI47_06570 [Deltaproteobacteria bacterium]|nr:hypothetical protein [Deltaproteobacteria bacterium]
MEEKYCINAAVQTKFGVLIRGVACPMKGRWLSIQSDGFIRPGTDVDTVLFLKEPARHSGQVRWTLAEPTEDKIVYKMGILLPLDEPVS